MNNQRITRHFKVLICKVRSKGELSTMKTPSSKIYEAKHEASISGARQVHTEVIKLRNLSPEIPEFIYDRSITP